MKDTTPRTIHLKNYKKPDYLIPELYLDFIINDEYTTVKSKLTVEANYDEKLVQPLILNGENLELLSVTIDGNVILTRFDWKDVTLCMFGLVLVLQLLALLHFMQKGQITVQTVKSLRRPEL